jgi:hypothetical protein
VVRKKSSPHIGGDFEDCLRDEITRPTDEELATTRGELCLTDYLINLWPSVRNTLAHGSEMPAEQTVRVKDASQDDELGHCWAPGAVALHQDRSRYRPPAPLAPNARA